MLMIKIISICILMLLLILVNGCGVAEVPEEVAPEEEMPEVEEEVPEEVAPEEEAEEVVEIDQIMVEWNDEGEGIWVRNIPGCESIFDYVCVENCYENTEVELPFGGRMNVWDCEFEEDITRETDTGVEVICFTQGCVPQADCSIVCPT